MVYTVGCVLPEPELLVSAVIGKFDDAGNVPDPELRSQVADMVTSLRDRAERIRMPEARAASRSDLIVGRRFVLSGSIC